MASVARQLAALVGVAVCASTPAYAQDDEPGGARGYEEVEYADPPSPYRNPRGTIAASGILGVGVGVGGNTTFVVGAGIGYAFITGILVGARGQLIAGDLVGGELAGTLTLTPPLPGTFTPFLLGEFGRRFVEDFTAWFYGIGGGVYLGEPSATVNLQLGYVHRWFVYGSGTVDVGAPLVGISMRF
ncbi:MAG: hypothetical protein RMA76_31310 [Deltaproteobacteria bacterium]